ncbi:MAG TPA: hypothetical protein DIT34_04580 [Acinetobacter ursingii]|uniref:Uncharacterized protein n=4 Tax=Moraxellaceae TaxID=468 RepID=N9DFB5_9GAMM|nr:MULTISPECIES: hypothetical protein [Acinetobacter]MEC8058312.1 hypothetical protein [Pseudomonadota bacterium]ENV76273.1 hypothetical protein F944_01241 [Acinetobacter ursingii DSM 16037 = CIP 107286]ENV79455.1 hypothetical protein F942_02241 [Acinetobacter ursingii ANC 3649]ENX48869.1 hypothetical protein F943_02406 [Acinetobacter ursingii NIPH 706]EXD38010.1 hypothetical protein J500_0471 [Acinetobacter sp. 479375]
MRLVINKSMKNIYIVGLLSLCCSFAMADEAEQKQVETEAQAMDLNANTIQIETRPEIMGLWGMEIPTNKKCVEYYNFRNANEVVVKSGKEWSYGVYDYQPSQDMKEKLPALIMQIKYDNNEVDCSGQQEDQSGEVSQYFVQWKSPNTINFCAGENGQQCFATLRRVLP